MGQSQSLPASVRNTIDSDQFLAEQLAHHEIVDLAFRKCVVPSTLGGNSDSRSLTREEKECVHEYALLYAVQRQKGYIQFRTLFEQYQQRAMEKFMQENKERVAREDLHR